MDQIEIRKVTVLEINELQTISRQTFFETFAEMNSEENMKKYLDENFNPDQLSSELSTADSEFYFAILQNRVVGYLKLNFGSAQTELKDTNAIEIERIYVLKEFHGKKVGQLLYDTALKIATQSKVSYVWLGVWENNFRAQSFYRKNGFTVFGEHGFTLGEDQQTDLMMKLELQ